MFFYQKVLQDTIYKRMFESFATDSKSLPEYTKKDVKKEIGKIYQNELVRVISQRNRSHNRGFESKCQTQTEEIVSLSN